MRRTSPFQDLLIRDGMTRPAARRWESWLDRVYRNVPLSGRRVLDIGAGTGLHTLYAASRNASSVVALEPGGRGARGDVVATLKRRVARLSRSQCVEVAVAEIDELDLTNPFDVVICINVINHIDERLVAKLPHDLEAVERYCSFFSNVRDLLQSDGTLVLADVSPENRTKDVARLFNLPHPCAPTINWALHQPPEIWVTLAQTAGLRSVGLAWPAPRQLGWVHWSLETRTAARFLQSYFVLLLNRS